MQLDCIVCYYLVQGNRQTDHHKADYIANGNSVCEAHLEDACTITDATSLIEHFLESTG